MKVKLTDKLVASYKWKGSDYIIRDIELRGFFLSVSKSRKSFKIQVDVTKDERRHSIRRTLGTHAEISVEVARNEARRTIQHHKDPVPDKKPERCFVSFPEWASEAIRKTHKASSLSHRNLILRRVDHYFRPWENKQLEKIVTSDALQLLCSIKDREGASSAKICARLMGVLFQINSERFPNIDTAHIAKFIAAERHDFSKENNIPFSKLHQWRLDIEKLHSVQRQNMHLFHLYSGLKPSVLVRIQRDWVHLEEAIIRFPIGSFANDHDVEFPLSNQLRKFAAEAYEFSVLPHPDCKYLFPNSQNKDRPTICREKRMMGRTGYILRNTYLEVVKNLKVPDDFLKKTHDVRCGLKLAKVPLTLCDSLAYQNKISLKIDRLVCGKR